MKLIQKSLFLFFCKKRKFFVLLSNGAMTIIRQAFGLKTLDLLSPDYEPKWNIFVVSIISHLYHENLKEVY
jgi:hypothetical protein